jgi:hypothetical protein
MPFLESRSFESPFPMLEGADYSHFRRFRDVVGEHLLPHISNPDNRNAINMNLIMMEDFRFSAKVEPGLELVDIVTNATRRALRGELSPIGWRPIRGLMTHRKHQYIGMNHFFKTLPALAALPYQDVLVAFRRGGRNMVVDRNSWRRSKKKSG